MSVGDPITIEKQGQDGAWEPYLRLHCLNVNKTRSSEYVAAGGEQNAAHVTFRVRWSKKLSDIEFDTPSYRIVWRGKTFDVRGYDDFQYQHRRVDLMGVSYGNP